MGRLRTLDSLRGLAALIVVFHHFSLVVPGVSERINASIFTRLFVAGRPAVYVFFVLSGFVLYLSLTNRDDRRYIRFAAKRLVRLYPPVAAAVLLSAALYVAVQPQVITALRGWFTDTTWTDYPTPSILLGHLLLLNSTSFRALDNPMWSLVIELRLSLVFPLIATAIRSRSHAALAVCVAISLVCRRLSVADYGADAGSLLYTGQCVAAFGIGAYLAEHHETLIRSLSRVPLAPLLALALVLLCLRGSRDWYSTYAGAALLVAVSFTHSCMAKIYAWPPFAWLGQRSFSLYLVHVPVLTAAVYLFYGFAPVWLILMATFPVCFVAAELFWRGVERPSMLASKAVGRRLTATPSHDHPRNSSFR